MSADPERVPVVDLGQVVGDVMRGLVDVGYEDEDGDTDPWPAIPD